MGFLEIFGRDYGIGKPYWGPPLKSSILDTICILPYKHNFVT